MKPKEKVSDNFERAFSSGSGGCVRDCHCGVTCFDIHNTWDWEDGELERLIAKAEKNPEKYQAMPHSVSTMTIEGKEFVMGCQNCERPAQIEAWIISHGRQIAEYLNLRANDLEKEAKHLKVKQP